MIHLVLGRQGSGKTLFLVKKAYEYWKKGYKVYSNIALKFPYTPINLQDIVDCKLENGIVIWDEIHVNLPARRSMSKKSIAICDGFLSMIRKKKLEVYGTTQTPYKVDVRFRDEKDYVYLAEKWIYTEGSWQKDNKDFDKDTPVMIKLKIQDLFNGAEIEYNFLANSYYDMYDTEEIVKIEDVVIE